MIENGPPEIAGEFTDAEVSAGLSDRFVAIRRAFAEFVTEKLGDVPSGLERTWAMGRLRETAFCCEQAIRMDDAYQSLSDQIRADHVAEPAEGAGE